jgi:hypothetical protein
MASMSGRHKSLNGRQSADPQQQQRVVVVTVDGEEIDGERLGDMLRAASVMSLRHPSRKGGDSSRGSAHHPPSGLSTDEVRTVASTMHAWS